ncbi:hypothetical protein GLX30_00160 [Streptomyces sp. Tu 2975]|uniref:hypothetical protein n=1 Tax=Streptomyces sp. Tu 2975 TaxID=2676871 RepID=UPI0013576FD0|nr:hypothetical protein [Streptomyces sp. Tu 2975]QIP82756.1 hypothetical protein GLX30_00160 [Streptomyces sp. Tu 2975]
MNQLGDKPEEVRKQLEEEKRRNGKGRPEGEKTGDATERADRSGEASASEELPGNEDEHPL